MIEVGKIFGLWEVIGIAPVRRDGQGARWICRCECGAQSAVRAVYLRKGLSTSCGCRGKLHLEKNRCRFFEKIGPPDSVTGCWPWIGPITRGGYGNAFFMGKIQRANRVSYMLHKGEIQSGYCVCHKCDNPACVNPDHLFIGTAKDNIRDMHSKGRAPKSNPKAAGVNNVRSKLDDDKVREIRALVAQGVSKAEVGRRYGVRDSHVCKIVQRDCWRHVP
jgi:hypothetical protein